MSTSGRHRTKMVRKEIDWTKVETLASLKLSCQVVVDWINNHTQDPDERLSHTTLERRVQEKYGMTWGQFQQAKMAGIKAQLVNKALSMAMSGDRTLLIFCLKNIVGWQDKIEETIKHEGFEIKLSYKAEEKTQEAIEVESVAVESPK